MSKANTSETNGSAPASDRDSRGRFAAGNKGGPGNPFARKTAALRQALIDAVSPDDMKAIAEALVGRARAGHVPSAKLLFSYLIGKPADSPSPDHLDAEEWQLFKNTAGMFHEMPQLLTKPDPGLPLDIIRRSRPAMADELGGRLFRTLVNPEEEMAKMQSALAGAGPRYPAPLPEFFSRAYPSPNGENGAGRSCSSSAEDMSAGHAGANCRIGKAATKNGRPSANGKNGHGGAMRTPEDTAVATLLKEPPAVPPSPNGD